MDLFICRKSHSNKRFTALCKWVLQTTFCQAETWRCEWAQAFRDMSVYRGSQSEEAAFVLSFGVWEASCIKYLLFQGYSRYTICASVRKTVMYLLISKDGSVAQLSLSRRENSCIQRQAHFCWQSIKNFQTEQVATWTQLLSHWFQCGSEAGWVCHYCLKWLRWWWWTLFWSEGGTKACV